MKIAAFDFYPMYGMFTLVCRAIVGKDFYDCDFTDADFAQKFSWHDGHVTLFTTERDTDVEIMLSDTVDIRHDAIHAIQLPFRVEGNLGIEIDNSYNPINIGIPDGHYAVIFEHGYQGNPQTYEEEIDARLWRRIWFKPEANAEAKILIQDCTTTPPRQYC